LSVVFLILHESTVARLTVATVAPLVTSLPVVYRQPGLLEPGSGARTLNHQNLAVLHHSSHLVLFLKVSRYKIYFR
jgi:hypothetical protein